MLGRYLLRELAGRNKRIIAIYRTEVPQSLSSDLIEWVKGDIHDVVLLEELMQKCEEVYHCAAKVSFNPKNRSELLKVNVEGTANIVNAALRTGIKKLVYVSSVSALGRKRDGMQVTEESKWEEDRNNSYYGYSKYLGEIEVWRGICEGLKAVIVNPTFILGVGRWEKEGSAAIFKKAWDAFPWYTEGVSGFVDAADVAKVMVMLMQSDICNERFIISAENWSFRKLFTAMATFFEKRVPYKKASPIMTELLWRIEKLRCFFSGTEPLLTREAADTARIKVFFDNSKLLRMLPGFSFKSLQQTIEEYCKAYKMRQ